MFHDLGNRLLLVIVNYNIHELLKIAQRFPRALFIFITLPFHLVEDSIRFDLLLAYDFHRQTDIIVIGFR